MKTDYKNLSLFEAASVVMIVIGIGLIGLQIFISLPENAQDELAQAFQVFEMNEAIAEVIETQSLVNKYVFGGVGEFYNEFYLALSETLLPVGLEVEANIATVRNSIAQIGSLANELAQLSENIASSYSKNYAASGVETSTGGQIMGAFIEKLSQ